MHLTRWLLAFLVALPALLSPPTAAAEVSPPSSSPGWPVFGGPVAYAATTGHHLSGAFLIAWRALGGRAVFGEPLSDVLLDSRGRWVQVTENALLSLPGAALPSLLTSVSRVTIEPLGAEMTANRRLEGPFLPIAEPADGPAHWFPETGHALANGFLAHWQATDGALTLGPPVSEEFDEYGVVVQWFERGRLEVGDGGVKRTRLGRLSPRARALIQPPSDAASGAVALESLPALPSPSRLVEASANGFGLGASDARTVLAPVGKGRPLPLNVTPPDLLPAASVGMSDGLTTVRQLVVPDLLDLAMAAEAAGLRLQVISGHRSPAYQAAIVEREVRYLRSAGLSEADARREAARTLANPGESEHHLGTAIDFNRTDDAFAATPEARFLAKEGWRFGFLVSYPPGVEAATGYVHEPWHLRWVGRPLAAAIHADGRLAGSVWQADSFTVQDYLDTAQLLLP